MTYKSVEDDGFRVEVADARPRILDVTDVVLCAGQTSVDDLFHGPGGCGLPVYALEARAASAGKRRVDQGVRLAANVKMARIRYGTPVGWQARRAG